MAGEPLHNLPKMLVLVVLARKVVLVLVVLARRVVVVLVLVLVCSACKEGLCL